MIIAAGNDFSSGRPQNLKAVLNMATSIHRNHAHRCNFFRNGIAWSTRNICTLMSCSYCRVCSSSCI